MPGREIELFPESDEMFHKLSGSFVLRAGAKFRQDSVQHFPVHISHLPQIWINWQTPNDCGESFNMLCEGGIAWRLLQFGHKALHLARNRETQLVVPHVDFATSSVVE